MQYPHRQNPDGSIDSICPRCYITVASASEEADLRRTEAAHVCDAWRIDYYEHPAPSIPYKAPKPQSGLALAWR